MRDYVVLVFAICVIVVTTVNVPSGFTEVWRTSSSSSTTSEMSQEFFASTGATGTIHGTHNGGANSNITLLIALEPTSEKHTPAPHPPQQPVCRLLLPKATTSNNDAGCPKLTIPEPARP